MSAICRHCGAVIIERARLGEMQWRDLGDQSPWTCFKARDLAHMPGTGWRGAGEQESQDTRVEAGNETREQPQAIRADAPPADLRQKVAEWLSPGAWWTDAVGEDADDERERVRGLADEVMSIVYDQAWIDGHNAAIANGLAVRRSAGKVTA